LGEGSDRKPMQQASKLFSTDQRQRIDRAVAEAETKTSAEIVPVVASTSGRYDRAEDIVGLWFAMLATVVLWIFLPRASDDPGSWGGIPLYWQIVFLIAAMLLTFVLGAMVGGRVGWLRRLFAARREMQDDVAARARSVFFDSRIHHTADATGVLLYVSLFEHMAAVMADQRVLEKLGQPAVDELCEELTNGLQAGDITEALCRTIASAGQRLSAVLPRVEDDVNELSDALVMLD
jgi:putative membrane protein